MRNRSPHVVEALAGERVLSVHAGWEFSLALLEGGTVVGWGWNTYGQLGIAGQGAAGPRACFPTPTAMAGFGEAPLMFDDEERENLDDGADVDMKDNQMQTEGAATSAKGGHGSLGSHARGADAKGAVAPRGDTCSLPPPPTLSTMPDGGTGGKGGRCEMCGRAASTAADMCLCPVECTNAFKEDALAHKATPRERPKKWGGTMYDDDGIGKKRDIELGEEPYRRMMGIGRDSVASLGCDWDEDAAPLCEGGAALPPGGPIQYASEKGNSITCVHVARTEASMAQAAFALAARAACLGRRHLMCVCLTCRAGRVGEGGLEWIYGGPPEVGKEVEVRGGAGRRWGGKAVLVATGYTHTVIASQDGGLWACGSNEHGQLGNSGRSRLQLLGARMGVHMHITTVLFHVQHNKVGALDYLTQQVRRSGLYLYA